MFACTTLNTFFQRHAAQRATPCNDSIKRLTHRWWNLPFCLVVGCLIVGSSLTQAADAELLKKADTHLNKGRYAEAVEVLDQYDAAQSMDVSSAIRRSRALKSIGDWKAATAALTDLLDTAQGAPSADLLAELADVEFSQGMYDEAKSHVEQALKLNREQPRAHLIQAHLYREQGNIKAANYGYRWFVRLYNQTQPTDAETLIVIGEGAAEYARWNRSAQVFRFLVNTLCRDILKDDSDAWQSYALSGGLLLEKYNRAQGVPELERGLAINPQAVPILIQLGQSALAENDIEQADKFLERALQVNNKDVSALHLKSDLLISAGNLSAALAVLEEAQAVNPRSQETLARLAACYLQQDGMPTEEQFAETIGFNDATDTSPNQAETGKATRFKTLLLLLKRHNKRPGEFFAELGTSLESQRHFRFAELCYLKAIETVPELSTPQSALGMLYMRTGDADSARTALDAAFQADPFHVRVSNMRKVLDVLESYEPVTSDNFVIYVDSSADSILAEYMQEYLESVHGQLVEQFDFQPPVRTRFEIYNDAKQTKAHQWFSARMAGLPWIQTIGASTGMMVALASPTAVDEPFNWARVLKHEYVHIITLQQTDFRIPHWYTEALAVTSEGYPRPERWNQLLAERFGKGELFNLKTINGGFQRPRSADDWLMAYCQSQLYAEYLTTKFGDDSLARLLGAYRGELTTEQAIPRLFGIDVETFEKGYLEMIESVIAEMGEPVAYYSQSLDELKQAYEADNTATSIGGIYAYKLLHDRKRQQGREVALDVLAKDASQPWAALTLAELSIRAQQFQKAIDYLTPAVNETGTQYRQPIYVLARLLQHTKDLEGARQQYERGCKLYPTDLKLAKGLAEIYKALAIDDKYEQALVTIARIDGDNFETRKTLTELASKREDSAAVIEWGQEALHIDVLSLEVHQMLASAYIAQKLWLQAQRELKVISQLAPDDKSLPLQLAQVQIGLGEKSDAKGILQKLLTTEPENKKAKSLLESLTE